MSASASRAVVPPDGDPVIGTAGASAMREYERRKAKRERAARDRLGALGGLAARCTEEPQSTRCWYQGAIAEVKTAERLSKHLAGHDVRFLHDRRIPGHGQANIDHLLIGAGGVTVVDTKHWQGQVRVTERGLLRPRSVLTIDGRERTALVDGVRAQVGYVRGLLAMTGFAGVEIRAALSFPFVDGLPVFRQLKVGDVIIDGPRRVAKLARRGGPLSGEEIERLWRHLGHGFPPA